ncbi:eCIS core domain-containing protein [Marinobacterium rhizophilum]|uniref:DUF4157 domain-containing protein n=1 Tax=Marinobacterium rhizophilum TaxID=420402 RepID=A0ABY5HJ76_9GAMM|nr:DUF4157 domain-containing protein [Marinobacterium rhizophilum]UTW11327.1 DUF4157 domain-containing protein [Marinobacterium rhizophilum]
MGSLSGPLQVPADARRKATGRRSRPTLHRYARQRSAEQVQQLLHGTTDRGPDPATPALSGIQCNAQNNPLPLGAVQDPLERQADAVADRIAGTAGPQAAPVVASGIQNAPENRQQSPDATVETEEQQARAEPDSDSEQRPGLWQRIRGLFSGGRPLPATSRAFFEPQLGQDLSRVRIHTDPAAAQTAHDLGARAYAWRQHLVFAPGQWQPESPRGRHLLAHELTHVVQQGATTALPGVQAPAITSSTPRIQGAWYHDVADVAGDVIDAGSDLASSAIDAGSDLVEGAVALGADAAWAIVRRVAPARLLEILDAVRERGFLGFIRDKISDVASSLFGGLADRSDTLGTLFTTFGRLASAAGEIVAGLARGDCEPLFAALGQLRDLVGELARDAFDAIAEFFRPVGDFFSDIWNRYGAPLFDWLGEVAGDTWDYVRNLGQQIWDWTRPVVDAIRSVISDAWDWIKQQLGLSSSEGNSSGGLIQWVKDQAASAWSAIKTELAPVIGPIQRLVDKVREILPLDAIVNFRDTLNGWLEQAGSMAQNLDPSAGGDAAENQVSLRDEILPAILARIEAFQGSLVSTGLWVATHIGAAVTQGQAFISGLAGQPLLSPVRSAFDWLSSGLTSLGNWAAQTVQGLFISLGNGLVRLSTFIRPVLDALQRILQILGNILAFLPDFLLGPAWWVLPTCIKDSLKQFFIEQILSRIPLFQQLMAVGDIWARVQQAALRILQQVFVDGDLGGALWTFFSSMLNLIGIPAQLVLQIIANAAQAFSDILMDPIGFFGNFLRSIWQGASNFFSNILTHLFNGVTGWLFGQVEEAGITPPDLTSFRSIVDFVFQLMGLTLEHIWSKLGEHIGQPLMERLRGAVELASGAFEWLRIAVTEGPAGLWNLLQQRLGDLWNLVLGSVANWVNTAIIATASRWLLSLLDVSGITPIINALIAVYRAIESFVQYVNELLQILNSVIMGIGEIARGVIDRAAELLESSLASGVPVVVGFLANQFNLGRLGTRIRELVESLRARVDAALDWIIERALRLGQGFLDMLRSGAAAVRNWWESRKTFNDSEGGDHALYFEGRGGELIVESTPTPVGQFLQHLAIAEADPQHAAKTRHRTEALRIHGDITQLKRRLETAPEAERGTLQTELSQQLDQLAVHLTPLLVGQDATAGGRIPDPLTLAALDQPPAALPRTPEEEQADLNGARQLLMLAKEGADGTAALSEYFQRIRTRFALDEVAYHMEGGRIRIRLRAARQQEVDVDAPVTTGTPGVDLRSQVTHSTGSAAGDTVGVGMVADPVGEDHIPNGSGPQSGELAGVMGKLVTDPGQRNPSKYIRGHLLNEQIGGPGTAQNLYPITGQANERHKTLVENPIKNWVKQSHYWVYYSVQVAGISEHIEHPEQKHPQNWINASFQCHAYVKYADGSQHNPIRETIVSNYVQGSAEASEADTGPRLDAGIKGALDALPAARRSVAAILERVRDYNADRSPGIPFGDARAGTLIAAYNRYDEGDLNNLDSQRRSDLSYINNRADSIRAILANAD